MIRLVSSAALMTGTEDDQAAGWAALNPASVCVCVCALLFTNSYVYEDAAESEVQQSL